MKTFPSLDELREYRDSGLYTMAALTTELYADVRTPVEVLRILRARGSHCFLFESAEDKERWGRFSFLGLDPGLTVSCRDGELKIGEKTSRTAHPKKEIRELMRSYRAPRIEGLPPFTGGLVGYFAYDYIKYAEPTLRLAEGGGEGFQDVDLMLFTKLIAFDHYRQKMVLIVNVALDRLEENYADALRALEELRELVHREPPREGTSGRALTPFRSQFTEAEYAALVEKTRRHIYEGDVFQLVLSNRLEAAFEGSLLDTYRALRSLNPSPYLFFLSSPTLEVAGASPETLVKLEGKELHTFPLAGTRPRGKSAAEDAALEQGLLADEKELSEHNMLVDLGRNDLGKISRFGTVTVERLREILRFSHVMHIGSAVRGEIREDCDALDAIDAVLPAGTLSGAPKYRAMELIAEMEGEKRGIYGGAIGYLDFNGNLDTCIGIRMAYRLNGKVYVRSGAGLVADSVPEKEYAECRNKAAAVLRAIEEAADDTLN